MLCADSTTFTVKFDNFANAKAIFSTQFVATMIKIRCILQPLNHSILLLLLFFCCHCRPAVSDIGVLGLFQN